MKTPAIILPLAIALSLVYKPDFWVGLCVILDFYTPWKLFESPMFEMYHNFLISQMSEKPEIPLPELTAAQATHDAVFEASKGYTQPLVIRNLLGNSTAVQKWGNPEWWINNYGSEELLCGTLSEVEGDECTVQGFFKAVQAGRPFYVSGASEIYQRHPELHEMMDNEAIRAVEPPNRIASQIFMGVPGTGSDIHCAIGVNVFRQIAGRKKWWFLPPNQTPYLKPSWNVNGFSAHTLTKIGKKGEEPSPWLSKLVRYTTILNPGDVLINPPWYWHGILNMGIESETDLVIGSPVRYSKDVCRRAAFKSNFIYTSHALWVLFRRFGFDAFKPGWKPNLQKDIDSNRKTRKSDITDKVPASGVVPEGTDTDGGLHPFEEAD